MKKILIVDDSKVQLMMMKNIMETVFSNYEIHSFHSPAEVLDFVANGNVEFEISFIDYNMEGMTGVELVEKLISINKQIIKLNQATLLSANIQEAVQNKARDIGIDFIAKPINKEKLLSFIAKKGISNE